MIAEIKSRLNTDEVESILDKRTIGHEKSL